MSPRARTLAIAGAVVLVAVLAGVALRRPPAAPVPTASPPATAVALASASPTAAATGTAVASVSPSPATAGPSDRYGYVFTIRDDTDPRIVVRRETDLAPQSMQGRTTPAPGPAVFELRGVLPSVSADGRRLAYWRTSADGGAKDLRVLDVAAPAGDRSVLTLTGETVGGDIVWSNDGAGLLVATYKPQLFTPGQPPGGCPRETALVMVDLATTPPSTRDAASGGCVLVALAWDRPARIAAGYVTGPGGYATEYVTWDGNAATPGARTPMRDVTGDQLAASADAKLVLAIASGALRIWPTGDATKVDTLPQASAIRGAFWRPGAAAPYEIVASSDGKVELVRYPGGAARTLHTAGRVGADAVRPDGTAVVVSEFAGGPPPPAVTVFLVDTQTGRATELSKTTGSLSSGVALTSRRGVLLR